MLLADLNEIQLANFWEFARGDMPANQFERLLYSDQSLEQLLGEDAYLEAVSVDFRDHQQSQDFRHLLFKALPNPSNCLCHSMPNIGSVGLGEWSRDNFLVLENNVSGRIWLDRLVCTTCQTAWLVAEESLIYDTWIVVRGAESNLSELESYAGLLSIAVEMGRTVRYVDPTESGELSVAIQIIAKEKPGISVGELSKLLPIDENDIRHHARQLIFEHGLKIDMLS